MHGQKNIKLYELVDQIQKSERRLGHMARMGAVEVHTKIW